MVTILAVPTAVVAVAVARGAETGRSASLASVVLLALGFAVADLVPISLMNGRTRIEFTGTELFVASALAVAGARQAVVTAAAGVLAGRMAIGRVRVGFTRVRVPATKIVNGVMTAVAGMAVALLVYVALEPVVPSPWAVAIGTASFSVTQVGLTSIVVFVASSGAATIRDDLRRSLRIVTAASAGLLVAGTLAAVAVDAGDTAFSLAALIAVYVLVCYGMTTAATARDRHAALVAMASELNAPMRRREVEAAITETACRLLHCDEVLLADTEPDGATAAELGEIGGRTRWLVVPPEQDFQQPLTEDRRQLLEGIAQVAAAALRNAELRDELERQAVRDPLTGLLNRRGVFERFDPVAAQSTRAGRMVAVLYLDVDDFKSVNDRHGHAHGDRVLVEIATHLTRFARASDLVARIGGDEFVVVMTNVDDPADARSAARRIQTRLAAPPADETGAPVRCSIGAAVYGLDGLTLDELLVHADQEMYRVKQRGEPGAVSALQPGD